MDSEEERAQGAVEEKEMKVKMNHLMRPFFSGIFTFVFAVFPRVKREIGAAVANLSQEVREILSEERHQGRD